MIKSAHSRKRKRTGIRASPFETIGKASRIMDYVHRELEAKLSEFDVSKADWDVLAALHRSGSPYRMMQRDLMRELCRTSGSMSLRIDALVQDELVIREPGEDDRRSAFVTLTAKGLKSFEKILPEHLANHARLLAGLTGAEQAQLARLLQKWKAAVEAEDSGEGAIPLGITVLSPRVSQAKRRAVGLPDARGVLIQAVESESPAATAGLRRGDLITAVDMAEIKSVATLQSKLFSNRGKPVLVAVLRGSEQILIELRSGN